MGDEICDCRVLSLKNPCNFNRGLATIQQRIYYCRDMKTLPCLTVACIALDIEGTFGLAALEAFVREVHRENSGSDILFYSVRQSKVILDSNCQ